VSHHDPVLEVFVTADLQRYEERCIATVEFSRAAGWPWITLDYAHLGFAQFWRGRWEEARETFRQGAESELKILILGHCIGPYFLFTAYEGNKGTAFDILRQNENLLPVSNQLNALGAFAMLPAVIEGLVILGEWGEAAKLYPLTLEAIGTGNLICTGHFRIVQTVAGIAAMAGRQWDKAEEHYNIALRQAHEIPYKIEQPEVRRWYARMLIERNGPGDKDKARILLTEAMAMYREIGMPKHLEMAEELLKKL
jgi:tetratricopeptide (TPR) repeat protein